MSEAYRCERCGEVRDGRGWKAAVWDDSLQGFVERVENRIEVELCPDCAAPYLEQFTAIAKTEQGA